MLGLPIGPWPDMRVLIDASGITKKKAGVGVYAKNLIDGLAKLPGLHLLIVAQDDDPDFDYSACPQITTLWLPSKLFRKTPLRMLWEQSVLPFLLRKHRVDVVHSLHYSFPLLRGKTRSVVTVHDMTFFSLPEMHLRTKQIYFRYFLRKSAVHADGLIFISDSARRDYIARLGSPAGLLSVIYHGKSENFTPCQNRSPVDPILLRYSLPARYILYIGTIEPRKNLVRLVEAFAQVAPEHPGVSLVIAGMKGWMFEGLFRRVQELGLGGLVVFPGFVAEQDKPALLWAAEVFAYVSLYEGFGLPVLEALACGVPTVTSNTSSLPEVAGDAALLVDPLSVEEIASALKRLLEDASLQAQLKHAAESQAAKFNWEATAEQTLQVYRDVYKRPSK